MLNSKNLVPAAEDNNLKQIEQILTKKHSIIDPNLQDKIGRTALHYAVKNINFPMVYSILTHKNIIEPDVNIQDIINRICVIIKQVCAFIMRQYFHFTFIQFLILFKGISNFF